ncbi:Cyclic nucleotide-binding protein [Streptococcus suis]|nr:Crp/Fnr family transcriptional regulator [Streptococcus suis]CAR45468.1 Crp family regulatory protein [Streptococcus suis P1/7]ADV69909.1 hypothetical protein SSUJS14_0824 [Streptococcus suis JS14]AER14875.1 hypothetical protein SSU12_0688 [Streptococcus suis SS12]AER44014.1 hypothetical protein SSUA7_0686 [Streptococcus suis A7]AKG40081.1 Crp/Fnr family transcriptional regulator [Streptococcus suis]
MILKMHLLLDIIEMNPDVYSLLKLCPYEILRKIHVKRFEDGEFELEQGEIYQYMYIIVEGRVNVYSESENGKKYFLCCSQSGDLIGEMEIFQQVPYISYVKGVGDIIALEIDKDTLLSWMALDQNFSSLFIKKICENSYRMCNRMKRNSLYDLRQRLAYYLLEQFGGKKLASLQFNSERLSQEMAVTQRSINRLLKEFKEKQIIDLGHGKIQLLDHQALTSLLD